MVPLLVTGRCQGPSGEVLPVVCVYSLLDSDCVA